MIAEKEFLSPGAPLGAGPDEPLPPDPPLLVRQGGGPFSAGRSNRRRRSADALPPPPVAAEMPYDTAGRVAYLSVAVPPDVRPEPPAEPPATAAPRPGSRLEGWTAVALAAALIVVIFVLGMVITR